MSKTKDSSEMTGKLANKMRGWGMNYIKENMSGQEWPFDEWIAVGDNGKFDLNLWLDEDDKGNEIRRANVYPPSENPNNSIDGDRWVTIEVERALQEKANEME